MPETAALPGTTEKLAPMGSQIMAVMSVEMSSMASSSAVSPLASRAWSSSVARLLNASLEKVKPTV